MRINKEHYENLDNLYKMKGDYKYNEKMLKHINELIDNLYLKIKETHIFLYDEYQKEGLSYVLNKYFDKGDVIYIRDYWGDIQVEYGGYTISRLAKNRNNLEVIDGIKVYRKEEGENEVK